MTQKNVADLRKDYGIDELDINDHINPIHFFGEWFDAASKTEGDEVNAFTLSTIGLDGVPNGRIVLLKSFEENGFSFFTNYDSHKGKELIENPVAAMTFYWKTLERQVRVRGKVTKLSEEDSDAYFNSRPLKSRVGAWSSPQSEQIPDRDLLDKRFAHFSKKFEGSDVIPRPSHWGGFLIVPDQIEFWQGRASRLHDRMAYTRQEDQWTSARLAP